MRVVSAPGIVVASWAVFAMMVIGGADVVGLILGAPITGALEFAQALMVIVIFLGLPYAERSNQHIRVDLFYNKFPPAMQRACSIFGLFLSLLFFGAMAWQGWKLFLNSWKIREYASGAIQFPVYPTKALFALGVTAATIVILAKLVQALRARRTAASPTPPPLKKQEIA